MAWFLLALVAHAGNALVFVVDKSLLGGRSQVSDPLRYTFYSAVLAGAAVVLLLFDFVPLTMFVVIWSAVAALMYIIALWIFFTALKKGEPSRVVPIAGSAVPAFTLLLAVVFLGEVLSTRSLLAVFMLIVGGVFLSVRFLKARGLSASVVAGAVTSGLFFAGYYAVMKHIYANTDSFLAVFAYSRVVQAVLAVVVLGPILAYHSLGSRIFSSLIPRPALRRGSPPTPTPRKLTPSGVVVPAVFVSNKILAAGAFILLNYAISLGSVTVVNALQGVQYVWLLLLAAAISLWWPRLFQEEFSRVSLWQKVGGTVLVCVGLVLLV